MNQPQLKAERITSPIQLMAAWFVMLILLTTIMLTAAAQISQPEWGASFLIISSSITNLVIITFVILMLTRFRPNLQEGKEYAEWLKDQNAYSEGIITTNLHSKQINVIQEKLESLKSESEDLEIVERIEDSLLLDVSISPINGANELVDILDQSGIRASVYQDEYELNESVSFRDHQAIWLGDKINPALALKVIKIAVKHWPHLKYIHLSTDSGGPEEIDWQIYLGGSTQSAVKRYKLKPWSNDEILSIEAQSIHDLHQKIKAKYP
ncbi:MAG: hypothetical protein MI748_16870 [Opitutales bacterium]|nr:hypothetical protein [Opitutales bacterium]